MKTPAKLLSIAFLLTGFVAFTQTSNIPEGWFKAGSNPGKYEMGLDNQVYHDGKYSAFIQSSESEISGFGTLMQTCSAQGFLGKKVKMTGYMKSENVEDWAGLWLRVDSNDSKQPLSFDNMQDRPIKGTTDWTKCEIVLDVPENSSTLNFGALLSGTGKIWFDNLSFEVVSDSTESTSPSQRLETPTNTSFDY